MSSVNENIMRSDPIYLFQELTWKASLGVLSVAGNVCRVIISEMSNNVNGLLLKLALVLECLGEFGEVCEAKEVMSDSMGNYVMMINQQVLEYRTKELI